MTDWSFYHLTRASLEEALPKLLERVIAANLRAVVLCGSEERVEALNAHLWTYDPASFLPHGTVKEGMAARQPIWLTAIDENPNGATVALLTEGVSLGNPSAYVRILDIFNGRDELAVASARLRYKEAKTAGHWLKYYQQSDRGWTLAHEAKPVETSA